MGRFWMQDEFIRKYAKNLSVHAQMVFVCLSSHADKKCETFIGYRKIAIELSMDKNTVCKKIRELEAYGSIRRLRKGKNGQASALKIYPVPCAHTLPSELAGHKEGEEFKDGRQEKYKGRDMMMKGFNDEVAKNNRTVQNG